MKEAIEDLFKTYEMRVEALDKLLRATEEEPAVTRLTAKRSIYYQVLGDLQRLLDDEQDKT